MTARQLSILALAAASFTPSSLFAQTSLSVGNAPGYPGATVPVPVSLRQPAGEAVAAQFDVAFDAGKVSAGVPVATARLAQHTVKSRETAPGVRRTLVYSLSNASVAGTNGAIVQMPFTVSPQATVGSGSLTPFNVILARADGTALAPVSLTTGSVYVPALETNPPLVAAGSVWKYLDDGSNQGTNWFAPEFDDSAWASGPAQLGYGDGDEQTVVGFGGNTAERFITTYFRQAFVVTNLIDPATNALQLRLQRDDGAVVYLNGVELLRDNMPTGPIGHDTPAFQATLDDGAAVHTFITYPGLVRLGTNLLAVEIHQWAPTSSDISFDLELSVVPPLVSTGAVWKYLDDGSDAGAGWRWPGFDDGGWRAGPAPLGYGAGGERTVVSYGPEANRKFITTYFRHEFVIADTNPPALNGLRLRLQRDDGAVVYLNGAELLRDNMPAGPIGFETPAFDFAADDGAVFHTFALDSGRLRPGTNLVAVEIHQWTNSSSDLRFDLELTVLPPARIEPRGGDVILSFPTLAGQTYRIEWTASLADPPQSIVWQTLAGAEALPGTGGAIIVTSPRVAGNRFYRLRAP